MRVETIVVGGGISAVAPFAAQGIPFVSSISPPAVSTTPLFFHVPGPPEAIVISSTGADPAAGASVALRVRGGIAGYEAGTNNRSYGDGHTLDPTPTNYFVAGRVNTVLSTAAGNCVLVGTTLSAGSSQDVMFGASQTIGTGYNASPMVTLGGSITVGNGGGGVSGDITIVGGGVTLSAGTNFDSVIVATNVAIGGGMGRCVFIGGSDGAGSVGASNDSNVVIGYRFTVAASKSNSVSVGATNSVQHNSVIMLGGALTSFADNQCLIGGPQFSGFINSVVIGSGDTNGTQHNVTIRLTNGSGTDNPGNILTIVPGLGTGAGAPGNILFQTGTTLGSGTTLQTATTRVTIAPTLVTFAVATLQNVDRGTTLANQTDAAGAATGTLTNSPAAGNPTFWLKVVINGVNRAIPCWAG